MTEVLHSPSDFASTPRTTTTSCPSSPSSSYSSLAYASLHSSTCANQTAVDVDDTHGIVLIDARIADRLSSPAVSQEGCSRGCETVVEVEVEDRDDRRSDQLSLLALLVTIFRKSLIVCRSDRKELCAMEIGWPTDVRHVTHVTFDRFNGFLGLPVELEPEVPRRPPSASTTVFGVSTESMQLSYDSRGNSVPTILLLMQSRLYAQGGLQAEGIFRINAENSHEEYVRDQLNRGEVPEGIDVHCLAGLIKAWFRELPTGVLDSLSPEQVVSCQSEEECAELARQLPPTEAALLDWAINLMTDVVQYEHLNKMNARNVAMVFAPNMTQMADALTALMYAVQVMNFLKTLILRTLRERKDSIVEASPTLGFEPSDDSGHHNPLQPCLEDTGQDNEEYENNFMSDEPTVECPSDSYEGNQLSGGEPDSMVTEHIPEELLYCEFPPKGNVRKCRTGQSSHSSSKRGFSTKTNRQQPLVQAGAPVAKPKGISNLSRIDSKTELIEAWR